MSDSIPLWRSFAIGVFFACFLLRHEAFGAVITLEAVEKTALAKRPTIAVERAQVSGAQAGVNLSRAGYIPTLAVNNEASIAPGNRLIRILNSEGESFLVQGSQPLGESGAFVPEVRYGSVLSLQSRIYDFGRTSALVRAAEARAASARAGLVDERVRIVLDVRLAYVQWVAAVEASAAADRAAAAAREGLVRLQAQVTEGLRREAELTLARHYEVQARLDALDARGQITVTRTWLESSMGSPLPRGAEPDRTLLERPFGTSVPFYKPRALEREREAALAEARAHESAHAPILSFAADAGVRGQTTHVMPVYRAAVFFSLPLLDGGAEGARAAVAQASAAELAAMQRESERALRGEHLRAEQMRRAADERIRTAAELLGVARQLVRDAEDRFELGDATFDLVTDARARLARAEIGLLSAKVDRAEAGLRVAPVPR